MRSNILNKALDTSKNKVETRAMNKELEEIKKKSNAALGDYPQKREELARQLETAEGELARAKAALDSAEDLEGYDKASEAVRRAELGVGFASKAIEKLDAIPRMSGQDYEESYTACMKIRSATVDSYREKAMSLMEQLKAVHDEYLGMITEVNETLASLSMAARANAVDGFDLYFGEENPAKLATAPNGGHEAWHTHDSILTAAWTAIEKGFPHRTY